MNDEIISLQKFGEMMGVSTPTVYTWKKQGKLEGCFVGRKINVELGKKAVAGMNQTNRRAGHANRKNYNDKKAYMGEEIDPNKLIEKIKHGDVELLSLNEANVLDKTMGAYIKELAFIKEKKLLIAWTKDVYFDISKKLSNSLFISVSSLSAQLAFETDRVKIEEILERTFLRIFEENRKEFIGDE